jgi:hypothetical protein
LSVEASIAHGSGDPVWAKETAREMAELETRYNLGPGDRSQGSEVKDR